MSSSALSGYCPAGLKSIPKNLSNTFIAPSHAARLPSEPAPPHLLLQSHGYQITTAQTSKVSMPRYLKIKSNGTVSLATIESLQLAGGWGYTFQWCRNDGTTRMTVPAAYLILTGSIKSIFFAFVKEQRGTAGKSTPNVCTMRPGRCTRHCGVMTLL